LQRISALTTPNQVLAVFKKPLFPPPEMQGRINLVLDNIQDPGNMGTIIRIADWFGLQNIICSEDSVDAFNSKVVQSTMGSISRVQVLYTPLKSFFRAHPAIPVYVTALNGTAVFGMNRISEGFIIIGNESKGISEELLQELKCERITIPKKGKAESLNAAVATGIVLSYLT
jgi:TrmH family RNA methyltransferase